MENNPAVQPQTSSESTQQPVQQPSTPPMRSSRLLIIILLVVIALLLGIVGYFSLMNTQDEDLAQPTPTAAVESTPTSLPSPSASPAAEIDNETIQSAIESKNYATLEQEMTDNVSVTLYASECCGPLTKTQAITQLEYLSQAQGPWVWDQNNSIIQQIKTSQPETYGKGTVGISSNKYVISYVTAMGKITTLHLSASYDLLIQ